MHQPVSSIESRQSWVVALVAVVIIAAGFGAPWIVSVALKPIAAEFDGVRSIPSLAISMSWFGAAVGGIAMGYVAERIGLRRTVIFGGVSVAAGLLIAALGPWWGLHVGYGVLVGMFGIGSINAPLFVYVTRWFDRRRGSALALISSGTYAAGAFWPPVFERMVAHMGWRQSMVWYAGLVLLLVVPLALIFLKPPPETSLTGPTAVSSRHGASLGWPPNAVFLALCAAIFLCCVAMSMPQQHLVALCSDLGIAAGRGAMMLSLLLGIGFVFRQVWGVISDRIGGITTVLIGSASQAVAMSGFILTQDEMGLYAVSAAFGMGFSGLIPAYLLAAREMFPASEASWRIPVLLLCSGTGMATGGWLAGAIYDYAGYYAPAFAAGIAFNVVNLVVIGTLVVRQTLRAARA
ncbi:MAG: MFS transporter [Variibacter sp.]|nr:MFS transporter [Variibacter sp.]